MSTSFIFPLLDPALNGADFFGMAENAFTNSIKITHQDANFTYCFQSLGRYGLKE
jgi:hypothetical protein